MPTGFRADDDLVVLCDEEGCGTRMVLDSERWDVPGLLPRRDYNCEACGNVTDVVYVGGPHWDPPKGWWAGSTRPTAARSLPPFGLQTPATCGRMNV